MRLTDGDAHVSADGTHGEAGGGNHGVEHADGDIFGADGIDEVCRDLIGRRFKIECFDVNFDDGIGLNLESVEFSDDDFVEFGVLYASASALQDRDPADADVSGVFSVDAVALVLRNINETFHRNIDLLWRRARLHRNIGV